MPRLASVAVGELLWRSSASLSRSFACAHASFLSPFLPFSLPFSFSLHLGCDGGQGRQEAECAASGDAECDARRGGEQSVRGLQRPWAALGVVESRRLHLHQGPSVCCCSAVFFFLVLFSSSFVCCGAYCCCGGMLTMMMTCSPREYCFCLCLCCCFCLCCCCFGGVGDGAVVGGVGGVLAMVAVELSAADVRRQCAGIHRNLGTHISRVKSTTLDSWTPEQIDVRCRRSMRCRVGEHCIMR